MVPETVSREDTRQKERAKRKRVQTGILRSPTFQWPAGRLPSSPVTSWVTWSKMTKHSNTQYSYLKMHTIIVLFSHNNLLLSLQGGAMASISHISRGGLVIEKSTSKRSQEH